MFLFLIRTYPYILGLLHWQPRYCLIALASLVTLKDKLTYNKAEQNRKGARRDCPDSKVYGAFMGAAWGRQVPGVGEGGEGHVGPMNLAIW